VRSHVGWDVQACRPRKPGAAAVSRPLDGAWRSRPTSRSGCSSRMLALRARSSSSSSRDSVSGRCGARSGPRLDAAHGLVTICHELGW